jgi:hypothetical protein
VVEQGAAEGPDQERFAELAQGLTGGKPHAPVMSIPAHLSSWGSQPLYAALNVMCAGRKTATRFAGRTKVNMFTRGRTQNRYPLLLAAC